MAEVDDEVVVFLIGMRVNKPWLLAKWLPTFAAMPKMLNYLVAHPERGLLGFRNYFLPSPLVVQYWRSIDDLYAFARNTDDPHLEAWRRFNRDVGSQGDVGIWHETFRVPVANIETIYNNMPVFGLAAATRHVPIRGGMQSAAARMGLTGDDAPTVDPPEESATAGAGSGVSRTP
jgi:hypothetical protein